MQVIDGEKPRDSGVQRMRRAEEVLRAVPLQWRELGVRLVGTGGMRRVGILQMRCFCPGAMEVSRGGGGRVRIEASSAPCNCANRRCIWRHKVESY